MGEDKTFAQHHPVYIEIGGPHINWLRYTSRPRDIHFLKFLIKYSLKEVLDRYLPVNAPSNSVQSFQRLPGTNRQTDKKLR